MQLFPCGHATHPQWRMATGLVLAQLRAQLALPGHARHPTLGLLYITDHYADAAEEILAALSAELPEITDWAGTVGVGVAVNNAEYLDEPALCVMLCELPPDQYRVFSGVAPLGSLATGSFAAHTALLHADAHTPDIAELVAEMADRTATGYLFGGLASSRRAAVQFAVGGNGNIRGQGAASGVFVGGLSGVAFGEGVNLVSRVAQGCQPLGPVHTVTEADEHVIVQIDGQPALQTLLSELQISLEEPQEALATVRRTLVGMLDPSDGGALELVGRAGHFGVDTQVRHIIGLDTTREGVAVAGRVKPGTQVAFCRRDPVGARADLVRICAEIREELAPEDLPLSHGSAGLDDAPVAPTRHIVGAVYVSCAGRGGPHFGSPSAEMQIIRRSLGDVPLVGFFAGGEIARHHIHGYTGVLTVFIADN
ncbi:FIST N-terminal domain-containing protein [Xylophilus sp. GOD-11R]|uniref:FIST signal transduction protein n=1 Tax=Xylophilus sp. GOD-11R TaxID=3089814 RepID=UPI00298CEF63|nr:FIST N-terminal domain-containing protein [Xylophilus sp. GOD-11R]WPB56728.1 FIST C-terminal domain-containing protein [Xylophilus sp. GOD-11R]